MHKTIPDNIARARVIQRQQQWTRMESLNSRSFYALKATKKRPSNQAINTL